MKRLVIGLLAALCFNALAAPLAVSLITPSPLGIVIAVKTYLKDQKKVYYIRVESQARDFEKAKQQAFRLASEQVAGTVVLSESELRNSNLTRDEIITYSSGLIDEYKIVDRYDSGNSVKLTMDVWIVESAMAQRLLAKSATEKGIDGVALSTRVGSILDEAQRGDAIIGAVIKDFPRRAFNIKMLGNPNIYMDPYRNTRVSVEFTMLWDEKFANALNEAAKETGVKPCTTFFGCPPGPRFYIQDGGFNDAKKLLLVDNHVKNSYPTILVELRNIHGQATRRECYPLNMQEFYYFGGNGSVTMVMLHTKHVYRATAHLNIGQNTAAMEKLENIQIEVVTNLQCRPL
jgi:hypothetical protein